MRSAIGHERCDMSARKIIQIVPRGERAEGLAALCDDGTVFVMNVPGYWVRVDTAPARLTNPQNK
jgi:hypothetical protein